MRQFRQRALELEPSLGRVESVASLTVTTVVVTALGTGVVQAGRYVNKWLLRANLAAADVADRIRLCSAFTNTTGTLTHAGTNYVDTTATDEFVEIHEHEPYLLDLAIQETLRETKRRTSVTLPLNQGGRYDLVSPFSWLRDPSEILRVGTQSLTVLTPNRHFERWGVVSTGGALQPDDFTLAGTGATFTRSTTRRRGPYSLEIVTTGGNVATVDVVVRLLESGVTSDSLQGFSVLGVAVCKASAASAQRVRVQSENAAGTLLGSAVNSSYHTGGAAWEELTIAHTVGAAADQVRLQFRQEANIAAAGAQLDELYLIGNLSAISDAYRRDDQGIEWLRQPRYTQNPLAWLGPRGTSGQLVLECLRAYPEFDATRLRNGTADGDSQDAPLDLIARGALYRLLDGLWQSAAGTPLQRALAAKHQAEYELLRAAHIAEDDDGVGFPVITGRSYGRRAAVG